MSKKSQEDLDLDLDDYEFVESEVPNATATANANANGDGNVGNNTEVQILTGDSAISHTEIENDNNKDEKPIEILRHPLEISYEFADAGSSYRMRKLQRCIDAANESGELLLMVASKRYPSIIEFQIAQEEQKELQKQNEDDKYQIRKKPVGEFIDKVVLSQITADINNARREAAQREAKAAEQAALKEQKQQQVAAQYKEAVEVTQAQLNSLKADMLRAKLKRSSEFDELEKQYTQLEDEFKLQQKKIQQSQMQPPQINKDDLKTRLSKNEDEMTVQELLLKEKLINAQNYDRANLQNIIKDKKFANDHDYIDEISSKLAGAENSAGNTKSSTFTINKNFDELMASAKNAQRGTLGENKKQRPCVYCLENSTHLNNQLLISVGEYAYVSLNHPNINLLSMTKSGKSKAATVTAVTGSGAGAGGQIPEPLMIMPISHRQNSLYMDEDEQKEVKSYMSAISKYYYSYYNHGCIFYEQNFQLRSSSSSNHLSRHCSIKALPIPLKLQNSVKGYFKNEIMAVNGATLADLNANHRLLIDTSGSNGGSAGYRKYIAKESAFFHVWFNLQGGYGHIIETENEKWPLNEDLFARRVVGGMLGVDSFAVEAKLRRWDSVRGGVRDYGDDNGDYGDGGGGEGKGEGELDREIVEKLEKVNEGWVEFDPTLA